MAAEQNQIPLRADSLASLPSTVTVPTYDRSQLRRSIIHIGVGGFHRAHLAGYIDDLCRIGNEDWSISGAGVLSFDAKMAEVLRSQDYLYSLITRGPGSTDVKVIGSIVDFIYAADSADSLAAAIAAPTTQIVSLTVTEGGYPVDDLTGEYMADSKNAGPASAFGILAAGLEKRRQSGVGGVSVVSCDNILGNGAASRAATLGEAERIDPALVDWIENSTTFPNSMVDRITPATTDADRAWLTQTHGLIDQWPVVTEPFRQWVIEDEFAADRLPIDELDILGTSDVEPYEQMKLRLLNASHSCLAYLSSLAGIETVDTAMGHNGVRSYTAEFLAREALPVVPPVVGVDLDDYCASLLERFSNPAIGDQISRLCLDGSAKFPKFLLPTVRAQLEAGGPVDLSALALAGWCEYLTGDRDSLSPDPLLDKAIDHARRSKDDPRAFLAFSEVFGDDLPAADRFSSSFVDALQQIRSNGPEMAIEAALGRL